MNIKLNEVVDELGDPNKLRHVVIGKIKHETEEKAMQATYIVRKDLIESHREFLGQEPIIFEGNIDPEKINNSIKDRVVMAYMVEHKNHPWYNFNFMSGKGETCFTIGYSVTNVETDIQYSYMVTPGFKYGVDEYLRLRFRGDLVDRDVMNIIDNPFVENLNKFNPFVQNGRTLKAFEDKDNINEEIKRIEEFEVMLRRGIEDIAATYDPERSGSVVDCKIEADREDEGYNTSMYGALLHRIRHVKNTFKEGITERELQLKLQLSISCQIFRGLINKYGSGHKYTTEFKDYAINWSEQNKAIQEKLGFDVKKEFCRAFL